MRAPTTNAQPIDTCKLIDKINTFNVLNFDNNEYSFSGVGCALTSLQVQKTNIFNHMLTFRYPSL